MASGNGSGRAGDRQPQSADPWENWLTNPEVRWRANQVAGQIGVIAGLGRGAVHAAQGLAEGAEFATRVMNPGLELMRPPGTWVSDEVLATVKRIADYSGDRLRKPSKIVDDAKRIGSQMNRDLNPAATPVAPTFAGELRRNFDIGQNQGELAFNIGSLAVGGPAAKVVGRLTEARSLSSPAKFMAQGFSKEAAEYLAQPYAGRGHHAWPLRNNPPPGFKDSAFNVKSPPNISRGDFYELHKRVDPRFQGARLPNRFAGESWSGKRLGIKEYGRLGRFWYGTPDALKARVGGLGGGIGGVLDDLEGEGE